MKLKRVRVQNYRCIIDSGYIDIDDVTCLVGKNEAGKTALLQALEAVRPVSKTATEYNKTEDYPRRYVNDYDSRHPYGEALVAETVWGLESPERQALESEFGKSFIAGNEVTIKKHYGSTGTVWTLPVTETEAVSHLVGEAKLNATERKKIENCKTSKQVIEVLEKAANRTTKQDKLLTKLKSYRDGKVYLKAIDLVSAHTPRFLYFSHYDRMSGQVSVEKMREDQQHNRLSEGDHVFLDFLEYAGTDLEELSKATQYEELNAKCEGASNRITDQIFEYWSQNDSLEIEVRITKAEPKDPAPFNTGTIVRARVKNTLHRVTVPFSERSAGFIWFFSFLVTFAQVKKERGNVIILLDEPGLTLHGKAQNDLLRYFDGKLKPSHQVLYTTHSPFMVPPDAFHKVRTVEDVIEVDERGRKNSIGTKVRSDVLATDPDTLFPLQGALGYEITQTLFVGKNTLLVEGPSDILYLQALSEALKNVGRTGLDQRWTVCPTGGIDRILPFVRLFYSNKLHVAVLADYKRGDKQRLNRVKESQLVENDHILTTAEIAEQEEADVEDILGNEMYVQLVNKAYALTGKNKLTKDKLEKADQSTTRVVKKVEAYFKLLPDSIPMFDHFTPARHLMSNPGILDGEQETLGRFEAMFQNFNAMLE